MSRVHAPAVVAPVHDDRTVRDDALSEAVREPVCTPCALFEAKQPVPLVVDRPPPWPATSGTLGEVDLTPEADQVRRGNRGLRGAPRNHTIKCNGTIVLAGGGSREWITHVGIYAGNGVMVNAPSAGDVVRELPVFDGYWGAHYAGAGRVRGSPLAATPSEV